MPQILLVLFICLATSVSAADNPLPAELVGEWRNSLTRSAYQALYISSDGTAYCAAVDGKQRNHGGKGTAAYDTFRRTLTISYPQDKRVFRFRYDENGKLLQDQNGFSTSAYKRKSEAVPDLSMPFKPGA